MMRDAVPVLTAAADRLEEIASHQDRSRSYYAHLMGKADGVRLARSLVEEQVDPERAFVAFALEVLASGGNGEGWTIDDAISALRVALLQDDAGGDWVTPVSAEGRARLRAFVGTDRLS